MYTRTSAHTDTTTRTHTHVYTDTCTHTQVHTHTRTGTLQDRNVESGYFGPGDLSVRVDVNQSVSAFLRSPAVSPLDDQDPCSPS